MRELPPGIVLRRAREADAPRTIELVGGEIARYAEWAPGFVPPSPTPEMRERLGGLYDDEERAWGLLALEGDELVGVAALSIVTAADPRVPPPGTIYLWQMFVRRDWQGRGIAGRLHDEVVAEARRRGKTRMVLWTPEGAAQARHFYEREGWSLTGEADRESHLGLPLVQYARAL